MPSSSLKTFSKHSKMKYNLQADLFCWMDGGCPSWRRRYHVHGNNFGLPYDDFICEVAILPSWLKKVITTVFLGYYNRYCVIRYNIIAPNWSNRRDCLCSVLLWWCKNETGPQIRWPTTHSIVCVGNVLVLISYCGKVSELIHHELKFCRAERLAGLIGTAIDRQPNGAALVLQSCQIH